MALRTAPTQTLPPKRLFKQYFVYGSGWIPLLAVAGDVNMAVINIMSDANFEVKYISGHVVQAAALVANWAGLIQIDDSARGKTFFDQAIPLDAIRGFGGLPYPPDPPRLVNANSSLTVTVTNAAAIATNVFICLHGNKLYYEE